MEIPIATICNSPRLGEIVNLDYSKKKEKKYTPISYFDDVVKDQNKRGDLFGVHLNDKQLSMIRDSILLGFEPVGQREKTVKRMILDTYENQDEALRLNGDKEKFIPLFPCRNGEMSIVAIYGPHGVGKSSITGAIVSMYQQLHGEKSVVLISRHDQDESIDEWFTPSTRVVIDESFLDFDPRSIPEGSVVIFDDAESNDVPDRKLSKLIDDKVLQIRNDILKNGRHMNIPLMIITSHDLMGGTKHQAVRNESTHVIFWPGNNKAALTRLLGTHYDLSKEEIDKAFRLPDASWVMLSKKFPRYFLTRSFLTKV